MRIALFALLVSACGGLVDAPVPTPAPQYTPPPPPPPTFAVSRPFYTDDTCAARPAAVLSVEADVAVTIEPGWHYDGSDPAVRLFDATVPAEARRICWRGDGPDPCPCRALEPGEVAYETRVR